MSLSLTIACVALCSCQRSTEPLNATAKQTNSTLEADEYVAVPETQSEPSPENDVVENKSESKSAAGSKPECALPEDSRPPIRLSPEVIQRTIRQNYPRIRKCYEYGLGHDTELSGRVVTRFVINNDGSVSDVSEGEGSYDGSRTDCLIVMLYCAYSRFFPKCPSWNQMGVV